MRLRQGRPPRIHGELLKLVIDIGETSVGKHMVRGGKPPSQTWTKRASQLTRHDRGFFVKLRFKILENS